MQIQRIEVPGLAHYSYIVSSNGKAVVIDPKRDTDTYLSYASAHDLQITHILETHIHADHLSRSKLLAEKNNVPFLGPRSGQRRARHGRQL